MFTRNYYIALGGQTNNASRPFVKTSGAVENLSSGSVLLYSAATKIGTSYTNSSADIYVLFGDGTTPPTIDDYKLSGNIVKDFSASGSKQNAVLDNTGASMTFLYTITNTGKAEITISEVALCSCSSPRGILYERTLLDVPVVIPAGGVGQVTYTISMTFPTA